jgi:hypothetical protein|tara:strand:- start:1968 stop:2291 length:324 start_codon:yes stop_codon:yes gene_type:complete
MKNLLISVMGWVKKKLFYILLIPFIFLLGFGAGSFHTFVTSEIELINQHYVNLAEKARRMEYEVIIQRQQNIIRDQQMTLDSIKKWMENEGLIPKTRSEASYTNLSL